MRRIKGFSIYPPAGMRGEVQAAAEALGRSEHQQWLRFAAVGLRRWKRKMARTGGLACRA